MIGGGAETCQDGAIIALNNLYFYKKIYESDNLKLQEFKDLIIGKKRFDLLTKIATDQVEKTHAPDPLEVHLCYQIELKEKLQLPFVAEVMDYRRFAPVTDQDLKDAEEHILKETSADKHLAILLQEPIWRDRIEKIEGFQQLEDECKVKKEEAMSKIDTTDLKALESEETKKIMQNMDTIWNPYYLLTQKVLDQN
jgi:E3 ubiquitin-protein ligase SspH2